MGKKPRKVNPGWVYLLQTGWHYKIGKTKNVRARVADLQTASPYLIELICAVYVDDMDREETRYHAEYAEYRTNGEWFELPAGVMNEIKDSMLDDEEMYLVGDVGDLQNYLVYMDGNYEVKQKLKTAWLEYTPWFPNHDIADGWLVFEMSVMCPCVDRLEPPQICSWCGGNGALYTTDADLLCGKKEPNRDNARRLTDDENRLMRLYLDWLDASDEDDIAA